MENLIDIIDHGVVGICIAAFVAAFFYLISALLFFTVADVFHIDIESTTGEKFDKKWSRVTYTIMVLIVIIGTIYYAYPNIAIENEPWEHNNYLTHYIVNLEDNSEIKGEFHGRHIRGYVCEKTTYHYYYKTADDGRKLQTAPASITTIYETDDTPRAEWFKKTRTVWWLTEEKAYCKIYIPGGSMSVEYVIDMR